MDDFDAHNLLMLSWALSRHESLRDAWIFVSHARCTAVSNR